MREHHEGACGVVGTWRRTGCRRQAAKFYANFTRRETMLPTDWHLGVSGSSGALQPASWALLVHDIRPAGAIGVAALGIEWAALGLLAGDAAVLRAVPAAAHHAVVAYEALRKLPLTVPELTLSTVILADVPAVWVGVVHSARPLHCCVLLYLCTCP